MKLIRIRIEAQTAEAETLEAKLAEVKHWVDELDAAHARGAAGGLKNYNAEMKSLTSEATRLQRALDKLNSTPLPGARLTGDTRKKALAQAGFGGLNLAQDVIQGGPASGINNIIGLASQGGIRSLATEAVAAAGGVAAIGTAMGALAVVAGSAFVATNDGLKEAKLGWSDLPDIIGNTAPWKAVEGAVSDVDVLLKEYGTSAKGVLHGVAEAVLGPAAQIVKYGIDWKTATDAVKEHKAEVEKVSQSLKDFAENQKKLKGFKSDQQDEAEKRGKLVGGALADLGGEGGTDDLINKLVENRLKRRKKGDKEGGRDEEITRGDTTKTRAEWTRIDATNELGKATAGDQRALGLLMPELKKLGLDTSGLADAGKGIDRKKADEEDQKESDRRLKERTADQEKANALDQAESDRRLKQRHHDEEQYLDDDQKESDRRLAARPEKDAKAKRERDKLGDAAIPGRDKLTERGLLNSLQLGGTADEIKKRVVDAQAKMLQDAGMNEKDAQKSAVENVDKKWLDLRKDATEAGLNDMKAPQRIGIADFARSIESSQDPQKQILDVNKQQLDVLAEIRDKPGRPAGLA